LIDDRKKVQRPQAVALRYNKQQDQAPTIVAKGRGLIADQIVMAARQNSVPVYQNKILAGMLMAVELDRAIPEEMYQAVAEVLAYVYRLDQGVGKRNKMR